MNNSDLYKIAKQNHITIERANIQKNKSLSVRIQNKDFIGIDKSVNNSADERTHLAHELGHCLTGALYEIKSPLQVRGKAERKANKWALKQCVPKDKLIELLKAGYNKWDIAEYFGVNEKFIDVAYTYYFEYGVI